MHFLRPSFAQDPMRFGRGPIRLASCAYPAQSSLSADVKLFAGTFIAGFLFVSILIG